ncbi:hypothetical protein PO909_018981 [Leuciscus waleckii]
MRSLYSGRRKHVCLIRRWTAGENFPPQQSAGYITFTPVEFVIMLAMQCRILKSLPCWPKFLQPNANRPVEESHSPAFEASLAALSRKHMSAVLC